MLERRARMLLPLVTHQLVHSVGYIYSCIQQSYSSCRYHGQVSWDSIYLYNVRAYRDLLVSNEIAESQNRHVLFVPSKRERSTCGEAMANAQNNGQEEQQGSWMRTILSALMVYFAINAVTSFLGGRLGPQQNVSSASSGGQAQQNAASALWPLGTKMVRIFAVQG